MEDYGLDLHCSMILDEYREYYPVLERMLDIAKGAINRNLANAGVSVTAVEGRVKTEHSLAGKLERKGHKYLNLTDLTDLVGVRVITFYSDDVDKVSAMIDHLFEVDWQNSVDKRKQYDLDRFGYMSLHYICRIPESLYHYPECPQINQIPFEVQMRTALQHAWSTLDHDIGYKTDVEIPKEYLRNIIRLAGILELVDEQFSQLRTNINNYRRNVQNLVASGSFDEVPLDGDSFRSYLELHPFDKLTQKIAAINQAEVTHDSPLPYLKLFKSLDFKTLGDVDRFIKENSEDAYQLAVFLIGNTDIDIISSTVSIQNLFEVYLLKQGSGAPAFKTMFDLLYGENDYNQDRAERFVKKTQKFHFLSK